MFYLEQQKLHIRQDHNAIGRSSVTYVSMLIDIMMGRRTHIINSKQICKKILSIVKIVTILCTENNDKEYGQQPLTRKEGHLNSNDGFKKLTGSSGFQLQIVTPYSTWVALNDICRINYLLEFKQNNNLANTQLCL